MLTRLRATNFKNLRDCEVRFGPFSCIAGPNGIGKSNLFDAIRFLSLLGDHTLADAAAEIRAPDSRSADPRSLFFRHGDTAATRMTLEADVIVPSEGEDDLGQAVRASSTYLCYSIELEYKTPETGLRIIGERLRPLSRKEAGSSLGFPAHARWVDRHIKTVVRKPFISTESTSEGLMVLMHQDQRQGRRKRLLADRLPRTVLSTADGSEYPTALMVRRELQSWRFLQLEPAALRQPDAFSAVPRLDPSGRHLPALLASFADNGSDGDLLAHLANRLSELVDDVRSISVDRDPKRELLTVVVEDRQGTRYTARDLSDGTLRFLALAALEVDPKFCGTILMEEPENWLYPDRVPAIIQLLEALGSDPQAKEDDEPLRQVVINTHSPLVVAGVDPEDLLVAVTETIVTEGQAVSGVTFRALPNTWRQGLPGVPSPIPPGALVPYLLAPLDRGAGQAWLDRPELVSQLDIPFRERTSD